MPNSERVALWLTEAVVGTQVWQHGVCATMPDEDYEATKLASVAILEHVVRAIDWPRLLADAEDRHWKLHRNSTPANYGSVQPLSRDVCGECLAEALLAHGHPGHTQDWKTTPKVERRGSRIDWPDVVARMIKHRSPSFLTRLRDRARELAENEA
jgi:hypothetical protein